MAEINAPFFHKNTTAFDRGAASVRCFSFVLDGVPQEKVEGVCNRAAYMPRRRELAKVWADMLTKDLPLPVVLVERRRK